MKVLEVLCVTLLTVACATSRGPTTAYYNNEIDGTGRLFVEDTISQIEHLSGDAIMHDDTGDLFIEFEWGDLEGERIGQARSMGFHCIITIDQKANPDSPTYDSWTSLRMIVMHEIGHCFGLDHSPSEYDVMHFQSIPSYQDNAISIARFIEQLTGARSPK